MVRVFDRLPLEASPVYDVGTLLGVFVWDFGSRTWAPRDLGENSGRQGFGQVRIPMSPPMSDGGARSELSEMERTVPAGLGMIVSWTSEGPGCLSFGAAAVDVADLDYGSPPLWAALPA